MISLHSNGYRADIDPEHGANCIRLINDTYGADLLKAPDSFDTLIGGMPVIFPANRVADGKFTFEGREYSYAVNEPERHCHIHGDAHVTPFSVERCSAQAVTCAAEITEHHSGFNARYKIEITYALSENGLSHTAAVTDLSEFALPMLIGFHTTFNVRFTEKTLPENVRLRAGIGTELERDKARLLPTETELADTDILRQIKDGTFAPYFTPFSAHYRADGDGSMVMTDCKERIRLVYRTDEKYPYRLFYGDGKHFLCLEPMAAAVNAPNLQTTKNAFTTLAPGQTQTFRSAITLEKY